MNNFLTIFITTIIVMLVVFGGGILIGTYNAYLLIPFFILVIGIGFGIYKYSTKDRCSIRNSKK